MLKIIVLLALFSALVIGGDFKEQYRSGYKAYIAKDFQKSYKIFSKLYLSKLSDAKLNFYLGRSAYETGHYEIALAAFERVEMLDPGNLRNKLEMARTYFMLKMYEDAQNKFQEVLENPNIPANVRSNIEMYLAKVKGVQKKSFTYANISLDWIYDSNVNYASLDDKYSIYSGGSSVAITSEPEKSDRALQVFADVTNIYDIGESGAFAIKNRVKAFLKDYQKYHNYSVEYLSYEPSLLYKQTKYLAEFVIGFDLLTLGHEEYTRSVSFIPKFEYLHTNTLRSMMMFKYQTKYFSKDIYSDLDSHHYEIGYSLQDILSPRSYIQLGLKGIREQKLHGNRIDVDYDEYRIDAIYAKQWTSVYGGELFGEYRNRNYKDYSTLFQSKRDDEAFSVSATVNASVTQTLRFHIKGLYDKRCSNQKKYEYQKYTITVGLNKTF